MYAICVVPEQNLEALLLSADKEAERERETSAAMAACSSAVSDVSSAIESITKSSLKSAKNRLSIGSVTALESAKKKFKLGRKAKKDLMDASSDVSLTMSDVETASRGVHYALH